MFLSQYDCCIGQEHYEKTAHILCHYLGGTPKTLREELEIFVNNNTSWIHQACADILTFRNQKVEEFCNSLIEPRCVIDELALTVICKMKNVHCLVLCDNTYWTTRTKFDYQGCTIKLCYLGGGIFKELAPKFTGQSVQFGTKRKNFSVEDPLSTEVNVGRLSDCEYEYESGTNPPSSTVPEAPETAQEDPLTQDMK